MCKLFVKACIRHFINCCKLCRLTHSSATVNYICETVPLADVQGWTFNRVWESLQYAPSCDWYVGILSTVGILSDED